MQNELKWTEENGVWKSHAHGFAYAVYAETKMRRPLWILNIDGPIDGKYSECTGKHADCLHLGQAHANAVQAAIDAACAKERENADRLAHALSNFRAMVKGESPSLIQDDNDNNLVDEALAAHKEARK
jgi:hypothetical protein